MRGEPRGDLQAHVAAGGARGMPGRVRTHPRAGARERPADGQRLEPCRRGAQACRAGVGRCHGGTCNWAQRGALPVHGTFCLCLLKGKERKPCLPTCTDLPSPISSATRHRPPKRTPRRTPSSWNLQRRQEEGQGWQQLLQEVRTDKNGAHRARRSAPLLLTAQGRSEAAGRRRLPGVAAVPTAQRQASPGPRLPHSNPAGAAPAPPCVSGPTACQS